MSTYRKIHGRSIQAVSTDPSGDITEGQVWYNTTSDTFKTVLLNEAWVSATPMTTFRYGMAGGGTQSAAFVGGGYPTPSPDPTNVTEEYNGSGWSTGGSMNTARMYIGGSGTQTAGLASGGDQYPSPRYSVLVEEYDGSSWTVQNTLPTQNKNMGSCGTQTASLNIGGSVPAATNVTNSYDGTNWTNTGHNLNTARFSLRAVGTTTSALVNGGSPNLQTTEEYDGSSWTSASNSVSNFDAHSSAGTQTAARMFGGFPSPYAQHNIYDGSSWSTAPNLGTGRYYGALGPIGTSTAALMAGGNASPSPVTGVATEEFTQSVNIITAAAWSSGGAAPDALAGGSMAGNKDDAMKWGGDTGSSYPGWPTTSHSYNGSSWTADGTIPTGVSAGGQAGAGHTDATTWGGYRPAPNAPTVNKTYEYNGSSWTAGGDLNDTREYAYATGAGPQTACIAIGSGPGNSAEHENYNGTAWSEETDFPSGSNFVGTVGSQTATLGVSGSNGTTATWNGSAWTASPSTMNTPRSYGAAGGANSSEAYMFGGGPTDHRTFTELYNGTSWASQPNMANGRNSTGGSGIQNSGLIAGPIYPGNTAVEEFTAETTTVNVKTLTQS